MNAMRKKSEVVYPNRNHTGWWIFREVEQWVSKRQRKLSSRSRCRVWVNLRLIRARNREDAYRKAMRLGREEHPSQTNGGEWRFAGISMLLPLYEKIEDGAEILWDYNGLMTVGNIKKLVKTKRQLPVFDDREEA